MQPEKILEQALHHPQRIRFADALKLARAFGFVLARRRGSHHILKRVGVKELLNFQNDGGHAKAYQIKQLLEIVENYNLTLAD
jgi:hypothetical protein